MISPDTFGVDETGAMSGLTFGSEGGLTLADGGRSANRTVQRLVDWRRNDLGRRCRREGYRRLTGFSGNGLS